MKMKIWKPPDDQPQLLEWWSPLLAFARRARAERVAWLVAIEDFELSGRLDRPPRPSVWIYRHRRSGGQIGVAENGQAYRFVENQTGPSAGRLAVCSTRAAVWTARLPNFAEPICYGACDHDSEDDWDDEEGMEAPPYRPDGTVSASIGQSRRARHLSLVRTPSAS